MSDPKPHAAAPGPMYWDYRCMTCDQPVAGHPSRLRLFLARLADSVRGK